MPASTSINLALFFTRGVSLKTWDAIGMFDREAAIYKWLQAHGIRVAFITYGDASDLAYKERLPGIHILCNSWGMAPLRYERWLPWLCALHLRRYDVFKTNQTNGADIALKAARLCRKPLIARCGYMWSEFVAYQNGEASVAAQSARMMEKNVFGQAKRIIVTTQAMAADAAERVPAAADNISVIPNFIDTELFHPNTDRSLEQEIIFIGRLAAQKNPAALLEAIESLDVRITMIGDGELRSGLEQRFANLGDRIKWLGNVPNSLIPQHLNQSVIFILPSLYEGHPKTLIEAMACGLPVIGADSPGIRDLIRHGETGWLCGREPADIRTAIKELLARPDLRVKLGKNARRFAEENFSLERVGRLELSVIRETIGPR